MAHISIEGVDYPFATSLRVAYQLQGAFDHKPYMQIIQGLGEALLEDQIKFLYTSFKLGNSEKALSIPESAFRDILLDSMDLTTFMKLLGEVGAAIIGTNPEQTVSEDPQGRF